MSFIRLFFSIFYSLLALFGRYISEWRPRYTQKHFFSHSWRFIRSNSFISHSYFVGIISSSIFWLSRDLVYWISKAGQQRHRTADQLDTEAERRLWPNPWSRLADSEWAKETMLYTCRKLVLLRNRSLLCAHALGHVCIPRNKYFRMTRSGYRGNTRECIME